MGDERSCQDLGLPIDEGRDLVREFQTWVESEKNSSRHGRPWFKIIQFWSGGFDCGAEKFGGFSLFYKWLDQFSEHIGRAGLFHD
jgi:hypothetical protein